MLEIDEINKKLKEAEDTYPEVKNLNYKCILVGIQKGFRVALGNMSDVEWYDYLRHLKEDG